MQPWARVLDPSSFATTVVKAFREWGQGLLRLATALVRENAALERENATLRDRIAEPQAFAADLCNFHIVHDVDVHRHGPHQPEDARRFVDRDDGYQDRDRRAEDGERQQNEDEPRNRLLRISTIRDMAKSTHPPIVAASMPVIGPNHEGEGGD